MRSYILGTGSALPRHRVTNKDLSDPTGLSEEEIEKKTGIATRYWATDGETTATLATEAAFFALKAADLAADAVDLIIVSTSSQDRLFPSVACWVQNEIGCRSIPAFDINASCSGFLYALSLGDQFIKSGPVKHALIIASEVKSIYLDRKQPQTASLFGDGAGAVVLSGEGDRTKPTLRSIHIFSGGPDQQLIMLPAGGSRLPLSHEALEDHLHFMRMDGTRLFRLAVKKMDEAISSLLQDNALSLDEMDLFIFHQANIRILEAVLRKRGIPPTKHHTTIQKFGNTSSSSLPIALDDATRSGKITGRVGLFAFGGGFTWGSALIESTRD